VELTDLTRDLEGLRDEARAAIASADDVATLEAIELDVLGRKGRLTLVLRGIGALPPEDRPKVGAVANEVRGAIEAALAERRRRPPRQRAAGPPGGGGVDVTTPGRPIRRGSLHPIVETVARSPRSSASSGS
jgi:phenylalanyl-tRNA synthetase alpha chain